MEHTIEKRQKQLFQRSQAAVHVGGLAVDVDTGVGAGAGA